MSTIWQQMKDLNMLDFSEDLGDFKLKLANQNGHSKSYLRPEVTDVCSVTIESCLVFCLRQFAQEEHSTHWFKVTQPRKMFTKFLISVINIFTMHDTYFLMP
jgi:hypothetical protein